MEAAALFLGVMPTRFAYDLPGVSTNPCCAKLGSKIARNKKACKKTHRLKINEVAVGGGVEPPKGS